MWRELMLLLCQIAFLCFRHVTVSAVVCFRLSICYIHSAVVTMISHELLLARPVGQYWHTVGVVDRNARGVVGCRRAGRVAGPAAADTALGIDTARRDSMVTSR